MLFSGNRNVERAMERAIQLLLWTDPLTAHQKSVPLSQPRWLCCMAESTSMFANECDKCNLVTSSCCMAGWTLTIFAQPAPTPSQWWWLCCMAESRTSTFADSIFIFLCRRQREKAMTILSLPAVWQVAWNWSIAPRCWQRDRLLHVVALLHQCRTQWLFELLATRR